MNAAVQRSVAAIKVMVEEREWSLCVTRKMDSENIEVHEEIKFLGVRVISKLSVKWK